jgi:hypothetical protein
VPLICPEKKRFYIKMRSTIALALAAAPAVLAQNCPPLELVYGRKVKV